MGKDLKTTHFAEADFAAFVDRLRDETALVESWEREGRFSDEPATGGFELEAWLVDANMQPAPANAQFLAAADSALIVPELSRFNVEFNGEPAVLTGRALSTLHRELDALWGHAVNTAQAMGLDVAMIGILPTVRSADMSVANMSTGNRYAALNEHVFRLRKGQPIRLDIDGRERLKDVHRDVMLEAATTSFQIHLKVPPGKAAAYYNASKLVSAPLVALAANAPFLFGRNLWAESRIPLFEQGVSVGSRESAERVTFGTGFVESALSEIFEANRQRYPVLMPDVSDAPVDQLDHLRLHNGTIWRWNRPLVGWDEDGTPHLRVEQRVAPAGPTIADGVANAAFFYGLVTALAEDDMPPDRRFPFETARDNFYAAARDGLATEVRWDGCGDIAVDRLILDVLLPLASAGLDGLGIDTEDGAHYLGIVAARVASRRNGAQWQRDYVARHDVGMAEMLRAYLSHQHRGEPVHLWPI